MRIPEAVVNYLGLKAPKEAEFSMKGDSLGGKFVILRKASDPPGNAKRFEEAEKLPEIPSEQTALFLESTEGVKRFRGFTVANSVLMKGIVFQISKGRDGDIYMKIVEVTEN